MSTTGPSPALSKLSLSSPYGQSNPIDLTLDDGDSSDSDSPRVAKRMRTDDISGRLNHAGPSTFAPRSQSSIANPVGAMSTFTSFNQKPAVAMPSLFQGASIHSPNSVSGASTSTYRPPFSGPSSSSAFFPPRSSSNPGPTKTSAPYYRPTPQISQRPQQASSSQVIDLTGSPSPPPHRAQQQRQQLPFNTLPDDLAPNKPVCIGQLLVTALILYPVSYLTPERDPSLGEAEWAHVRLQYEHNPHKPDGAETIHIHTPGARLPTGEIISEPFGVVEQKVATFLGPMLGKGLIRLDSKIRRGSANLPILPLQMLVYTPKGNIPVVGNYLHQCGLFLDHPSTFNEMQNRTDWYYHNPHNPPPGGHSRILHPQNRTAYPMMNPNRWTQPAVSGKSVEVQRSQVDELFQSLKTGDELAETEPASDVATTLYPHQKRALTFLLEREREQRGPDGKFSSLWDKRTKSMTGRPYWYHVVTQKEVFEEPKETKGAILADDMGLGKTITCVSLLAATLAASQKFASSPIDTAARPADSDAPDATHFSGAVWGMPEADSTPTNAKGRAKAQKQQERAEQDYIRTCRIKAKSRATLIICPLSTVSNWEDQFREHWKGEVQVVGGSGACPPPPSQLSGFGSSSQLTLLGGDMKPEEKPGRIREGTTLRVYIYHGNARRPDPAFLADFDAVITTYATLASEFSKQNRSIASVEAEDDMDEGGSSDGGGVDIDEQGNQVLRLPKPKKGGVKRKKSSSVLACAAMEATSALQSIHWFRVVLDEAHSIKETGTVGSRACCDLMADRRLCLTGTPVQNKLDDVFALIKFLRLDPFDDKNIWTEFIGTPVKFGQALGVARLQAIMTCITLRRTKESKTQDGKRILALPARRDEVRYLKFDEQEQGIYDTFFNESKAEFNEMSDKNEVMKNYVGILQKILRLRQICDHFELVEGKGQNAEDPTSSTYEDIVASITKDGFNLVRAMAIFTILRESSTTQCVECGSELCTSSPTEAGQDAMDVDGPQKRAKKKGSSSRAPTRASSPSVPRPVLTRCQHLFCIQCYRHCISPGWPDISPTIRRSCSACQTALGVSDAIELRPDAVIEPKKKPGKREKRQKGLPLDNFHPSTKVKSLLGDLVHFSKSNPYSANYDPSTAEVQMVDEKGNEIDDGVVKTVVFSQWTSMLDKIEDALEAASIRYDRLDGSMKRDERTRAMDALKYDPGCEVLLVSLKAGGVGLNLTAAQRVYLMDPYWNPAVENQAVDRIHRLGQTRPVTTVKLIIENSIESRLLEVQKKKTELANMTLGKNYSKADLMQRRMEELNQLFSNGNSSSSSS